MAAEALEEARAGAERAVQVERRRSSGPSPSRGRPRRRSGRRAGCSARRDATRRSRSRPRASPRPRRRRRAGAASPRAILDLCDRRAKDPVLDRLPVAVQLLELGRRAGRASSASSVSSSSSAARRVAEPPCGVDPRREPEPDRAGVDRRRIDARDLHQRAQAGLLRARERAEPGDARARGSRPRAGRRRRSSRARRGRGDAAASDLGAEQRLRRACRRRPCRRAPGTGSRTGGSRRSGSPAASSPGRWWSVTTTSSPSVARRGDLLDRGDAAVDREDEPAALLGEPLERLAADAVALVEAARQMPLDVGAELAQDEHRERRSRRSRRRRSRRGRRSACRPRSPRWIALDGRVHVAEQERDRAGAARRPGRPAPPRGRRSRAGRARLP